MRIAITLQSLQHQGGIGIYTQQIVKHLLAIDKNNEYVFIYPSFGKAYKSLGQFKNYLNVTEIFSKSLVPHQIYWDQCVIPGVVEKYGIDVFFNPLQSVPLRGRFRKVLTLHNSEWFIMPEVFGFVEKFNGKVLLKPIMRAADVIISVSRKVAKDLIEATGLSDDKFRIIHNGGGEDFKPITDKETLDAAKEKYLLPDQFILFVGGIYPQKNFRGLIEAFHLVSPDIPHHLVVAGHARWKSEPEIGLIKSLGLENRVHLLGWIDHDDLPAIYNLATCFVIPSFHESCSVALIEALSCGCPVIASDSGGNPEVVGDASILIDPTSVVELKQAILKVVSSPDLRRELSQKGMKRAESFSWVKCARETLKVFSELHPEGGLSTSLAG